MSYLLCTIVYSNKIIASNYTFYHKNKSQIKSYCFLQKYLYNAFWLFKTHCHKKTTNVTFKTVYLLTDTYFATWIWNNEIYYIILFVRTVFINNYVLYCAVFIKYIRVNEDIKYMLWPPRSPDFKPVQGASDILDR